MSVTNFYPFIRVPSCLENIAAEFPPEPPYPEIPPEPKLVLPPIPDLNIPPRPTKPKNCGELPPQRVGFQTLVLSSLTGVLISILVSVGTSNFQVFLPLVVLSGIFVFSWWVLSDYIYYKRLKLFRDYENNVREWEVIRLNLINNHSKKVEDWKIKRHAITAQISTKAQEWLETKRVLEQEYQHILEQSKQPEKVRQWREKVLKERLDSLCPEPLGSHITYDPRSFFEYPDNSELSKLLKEFFGDKIHILRELNGKVPDFAYFDANQNIAIDIEIDKPYVPRKYPKSNISLKLTHCLDDPEYEAWDRSFQDRNWFVVHLTEYHVSRQAEACCKYIAQIIYEFTGDNSVFSKLSHVESLRRKNRWTKNEALKMAQQKERLTHYCPNLITGSSKQYLLNYRAPETKLSQLPILPMNINQADTLIYTNEDSESLTSPGINKKVKRKIRKSFKKFLQKNPEAQCNLETKKNFADMYFKSTKSDLIQDWLRVNGFDAGFKFLEDLKLD